MEIRSEFVQGVAPEAEEGHIEEGDLGLMDDMNHEVNINHKGNQEGNIDHGNHEGSGGYQETWQQQAEMVHVVAVIALQNRQPRIQYNKFTPAQLQELESTFEHNTRMRPQGKWHAPVQFSKGIQAYF